MSLLKPRTTPAPNTTFPKKIEKEPDTPLPIEFQPQNRPFSKEEEEYFEKAEKLSKKEFRILKPIPGRLGYHLRNTDNEAAYEALSLLVELFLEKKIATALDEGGPAYRQIQELLKFYEELDYNSQQRVDAFDHICKILEIPKHRAWGWIQEALFIVYGDAIKSSIEFIKPALLNEIAKNAGKPGIQGARDRELLAKVSGLIQTAPVVQFQDNSRKETKITQNVTNNNLFTEFTATIKNSEKQIELAEKEQLQLTEGESEAIEADFQDIIEKEKVA